MSMEYVQTEYAADVQILKRKPFEGIAKTLNFTDVVEVDGKKVVKAGTPIGADGKVDNTATVVGILLHDVTEARPQGTLLKKAYIDKAIAQTHSGVTLSSDVIGALPMIVLE